MMHVDPVDGPVQVPCELRGIRTEELQGGLGSELFACHVRDRFLVECRVGSGAVGHWRQMRDIVHLAVGKMDAGAAARTDSVATPHKDGFAQDAMYVDFPIDGWVSMLLALDCP